MIDVPRIEWPDFDALHDLRWNLELQAPQLHDLQFDTWQLQHDLQSSLWNNHDMLELRSRSWEFDSDLIRQQTEQAVQQSQLAIQQSEQLRNWNWPQHNVMNLEHLAAPL